ATAYAYFGIENWGWVPVDVMGLRPGFQHEVLEETEANRLTYLAVQDVLARHPELQRNNALIIEVGGGSTELLLLQKGNVTHSNTYGLGALRLRETIGSYRASPERVRTVLDQNITSIVDDIHRTVPVKSVPYLIAVSSDARFAVAQLVKAADAAPAVSVGARALANFAARIAPMAVDDLVRKYGITFQEAETVGPALLVYAHLAKLFKVKQFIVPKSSLRDGLLREMASREHWTKEFAAQVEHSALTMGRRCGFNEKHSVHVADLALQLFRELQPEHQLDKRYELFLRVAALLHEIGMFINYRSYHKHTMYMLMHSDLFGLTREEMLLIALIARYHRRAAPRAYHEGYASLSRDDRIAVSKVAAILRVADALDSKELQQVRALAFSREEGQLIIHVSDVEDLTLERIALKQKGTMFEDIYGLRVVLREAGMPKTAAGHE
ncbi:MAG: HD domain-containing protein, partial [Verrucomicrobiae bacterium]|nr:HD domain-containing protein [Verrucomicrobiae bacterium]